MKSENGRVTDINIAYIGGGSRGWAWGLMSDLASERSLCGSVRLYDIDMEAAKANEIIGNRYAGAEGAVSAWSYTAVPTLEEALRGADFVVISILPGTFDEMESDVHAPEKYGIYQPVGDSTGPGGLIRAYRAIPMFIEFARAIRDFCPQAWVINYTNPMTLCVRTLYEVFPRIKAFGCCHEVFGTQKLLAQAYGAVRGVAEPRREDIKVNVQGVNHFTWIDRASYNGEDLFPVYAEFIDRCLSGSFKGDTADKNWANSGFSTTNLVKYDLFRRYGAIAAAGDRHLVEFLPAWYLKNPQVVKSWGYELTTVAGRKEDQCRRIEKSKRLAAQTEPCELRHTGEDGVRQIKALVGLDTLITNVNVPNTGQLANLPHGAVVETNAVFSNNSLVPVNAGSMKRDIRILTERIICNQETILEAVFNEDKELGFNAFLNDPMMCISMQDARALYEEMIDNTKKYIPWIK